MLTSKNQEIKLTKNSKPFVIAEVGVNHNGKIEEAKKYIDLVKGLGADSIKFQLYKTENLVTKNAPKAEYQTRTTSEKSQFELLKKLELSFDEMYSIYEECKDVGLTFICTPFDKDSLLFLMELNVPFIKLSSGDIDNVFFHEEIIKNQYPVILSSGMAEESEIMEIYNFYHTAGHNNFGLLHCTSMYPADSTTLNLNYLDKLNRLINNNIVGYSDHSTSLLTGALAYSKGAVVIEKHLTMSNDLPGPDHSASLNPDDFANYLNNLNFAVEALGEEKKEISEQEMGVKKVIRKSLVYNSDLDVGSVITDNDLKALRPASGSSPMEKEKFIGKKLSKSVKQNQILNLKDF